MTSVSHIYDNLFEFESNQGVPFPVHKKLRLLEGELLELIFSKVSFNDKEDVLDAGCGNGHTLFKLNERFRCSGLGVSLSHKEIEFAQSIVVNKGKGEEIDFKRMSYDTDFQKSFDKIFAIESIKHSTDLNYTIKNLWNQLSMNGYLIIADDFLLNGKKYLTQQSSFWESPGFVSLIEFFKILKEQTDLREEQIQNINLTPFVPTRNIWLLRLLFGLINPLLTLLPEKRSTNVKTYLGGILLELGYVNSDVSYNLLIIHKK